MDDSEPSQYRAHATPPSERVSAAAATDDDTDISSVPNNNNNNTAHFDSSPSRAAQRLRPGSPGAAGSAGPASLSAAPSMRRAHSPPVPLTAAGGHGDSPDNASWHRTRLAPSADRAAAAASGDGDSDDGDGDGAVGRESGQPQEPRLRHLPPRHGSLPESFSVGQRLDRASVDEDGEEEEDDQDQGGGEDEGEGEGEGGSRDEGGSRYSHARHLQQYQPQHHARHHSLPESQPSDRPTYSRRSPLSPVQAAGAYYDSDDAFSTTATYGLDGRGSATTLLSPRGSGASATASAAEAGLDAASNAGHYADAFVDLVDRHAYDPLGADSESGSEFGDFAGGSDAAAAPAPESAASYRASRGSLYRHHSAGGYDPALTRAGGQYATSHSHVHLHSRSYAFPRSLHSPHHTHHHSHSHGHTMYAADAAELPSLSHAAAHSSSAAAAALSAADADEHPMLASMASTLLWPDTLESMEQESADKDIMDDSIGFDRDRFVDPDQLNADFFCPICTNVVEEPSECPHCQSLFCDAHIRHWLKPPQGRYTCPKCNQSLLESELQKPSRVLRNILGQLVITCKHKERGCASNIKLDEYRSHLDTYCDYAPEYCVWPACPSSHSKGETINRKDLEEHRRTCRFRIVPCELGCPLKIAFCRMEEHVETACPRFVVECELGCGEKIERCNVKRHLSECPMAPVPCPVAGCTTQATREELKSHMESSWMEHLVLMNQTIQGQREVIAELRNEVDALQRNRHVGVLQTDNSVVYAIENMDDTLSMAARSKVKIRSPRYMLASGLNFEIEVAFDHAMVSLYLSLQPGRYDGLLTWPFRSRYTLSILDQTPHNPEHIERTVVPVRHPDSQVFRRKQAESMRGHGYAKFTPIKRLRSRRYIDHNTMYVKIAFHNDESDV